MPVVEKAKYSQQTKDAMTKALDGLPAERKKEILGAVGMVIAESIMHDRKVVMEEMRHQWADALGVMLNREPKQGGKS